jgi:hypothetical protein
MLTIVKKNDSYDAITYQLENEDNSTVDLTGASVNFVMGKKNKLITNAKATVTSATSGIVSYQLTQLDTLVSGTFLAEFVVTFANGTVKTYPSNGYITVDVEQNLDTSQANVVVDMIAEKQGDFTSKLNSILQQAGNINMSAMNEYSWTATEGQLIFIFPSSVNYTPSTKWFQVSVGNVPVDNTLVNRSYDNQFALNIDSSNIKAGMTVRAMWVEPVTPVVPTSYKIIPQQNLPPVDAGEGDLWFDTSDNTYQGTVFDDLNTRVTNNTSSLADNAKKLDTSEISAASLGMLPGTDITTTLLAVLSDDTKKNIIIKFKKKAMYTITQPIVIDLFKYGIDGNGCIFQFSLADTTKWGITLTSSLSTQQDGVVMGGSPTGNIVNVFKNIIMQTLNRDKNCNGLFFNNMSGKSAHLITNQIAVLGFNKGVGFGSNSYMITNDKMNVAYCGTCINLESGITDTGERLSFTNGAISDSDLMVNNTTDQALHFQNMSFDFSTTFFNNSGQLYFTNCHIEAPESYFNLTDDTSFWGTVSSTGSVFFTNCRMLIAYGTNPTTKKYLFNLSSGDTLISFINCHINIKVQYLCTGTGHVRAKGLKRYNSSAYRPFLSDTINLYPNETFTILPLTTDVYSNHNGDTTTSQPVLDATNGGIMFTHKTVNTNSNHMILLPTRGSEMFKVAIQLTTTVANNFFFNSVRFQRKIGSSFANVGSTTTTVSTVSGSQTINIISENIIGFNKKTNDDLYLYLNTFGIATGTTFTITSLKVIPFEY